jgi:hypothetical protein
MLALFAVLVAPIPKTTYEGSIGVVLSYPKPTLLVLRPDGHEIRRIELGMANPYTVKLARGGTAAIVTAHAGSVKFGNRGYSSQAGYLIPFEDGAKPKPLCEGRISLKWVLNRDATTAYAMELDPEKIANDTAATKAWSMDLKTGKQTPLALPNAHWPIDLTADDTTLVCQTYDKNVYTAKLVAVGEWAKPTAIDVDGLYPHGISPDGRRILASDYSKADAGRQNFGLIVYDRVAKSKQKVALPAGANGMTAYSFGADGKRVAFVTSADFTTDTGRVSASYCLYVANADGTNVKKIFEGQPGERISDVDWR